MLLTNSLRLLKMETSKSFSPYGISMSLFRAQCILGMIGNSIPFDSKFGEFRKSIFDAMMAVARCNEVLDRVYESENS